MENEEVKTSVFRKVLSSLSVFARTLPKNDVSDEIEDIDNLGGFSKDERQLINELKNAEAQLKKAAANAGSKKGLQKQFDGRESGNRTTIMKTVVNKEERMR